MTHIQTVTGKKENHHPDPIDRRIIMATQEGLPLTIKPYDTIAERLGLQAEEVRQRLKHMIASGLIRRVSLVPNHYRLGYRANAMTVWQLPDDRIRILGQRVAALPFVSHCYHRQPNPPDWPYNLFAMVHGRSRNETDALIDVISEVLGDAVQAHTAIYSSRILKKTGLRLHETAKTPDR